MKRLTILWIIACVGLLFAPAAVLGAGPPGGLDVNVVSPDPLPVTGDVNATVTGEVDVNVVNPLPLPVTGTVKVSTVYRFWGFSITTTTGDTGGIGGMHSICQTDLGDLSARMCTSKELLLSPNVPFGSPLTQAWVQPTIVTTAPVNGTQSLFDYSGTFYEPQEGTCFQWNSSTANTNVTQGMAFAPGGASTGFLGVTQCSRNIAVACCIPTR